MRRKLCRVAPVAYENFAEAAEILGQGSGDGWRGSGPPLSGTLERPLTLLPRRLGMVRLHAEDRERQERACQGFDLPLGGSALQLHNRADARL